MEGINPCHPELCAISKAMSEDAVPLALAMGVDRSWFPEFAEQWDFVLEYWDQYKVAPSWMAWQSRFPHIPLYNVANEPWEYVADNLRQHAARTTLNILGNQIVGNNFVNPMQALDKTIDSLVAARTMLERADVPDVLQDYEYRVALIEERIELAKAGKLSGIPTGFPSLDVIAPFRRGQYIYLFGDSGTYKSYVVICMAVAAAKAGYYVYIHSLEMSREETEWRIDTILARDAHFSQQFGSQFLNSQLNNDVDVDVDQYRQFLGSVAANVPGKIFLNNSPCSIEGFAGSITRMKQQHGDKMQVAILDYLGLVDGTEDWQDYKRVSRMLKTLTSKDRCDVGLWVVGQASRAASGREVRRHHSAETYAPIRDADRVYTLTPSPAQNLLKLYNDKSRSGPEKWELWLRPDPNRGMFLEVERPNVDTFLDDDEGEEDGSF